MADRWAVVDWLQQRPALSRDPSPHRRQRHDHRARGPLSGNGNGGYAVATQRLERAPSVNRSEASGASPPWMKCDSSSPCRSPAGSPTPRWTC